ncbi:hypothetical protein MMC11_009076 [Xylographa trunciseda]|nr:hypothetical protein [Xylographa trunciseda]
MTMTMDNQQRHHLGSMGYEHMPYSAGPPQFSNPWAATSSAHAPSGLFPTSLASSTLGYQPLSKPQTARTTTMSMPYSSLPVSAPPMGTGNFNGLPYSQTELLSSSQDLLNSSRSTYDQSYSSAPSQSTSTYATHAGTYAPISTYGQSLAQHQQQQHESGRRLSQSNIPISQAQSSYGDALDGARGMVAMSQDMTPRNIYGPQGDRGTTDSYGFPTTHSSHSSISSGSAYPQYFDTSSVNSSTDYSSASEMEPISSRTLPRPTGLIGSNLPPAPQSMMGSFNSKVSSNTQKKHKCKVCDKRFTRPSSLQTHMYSHTGEKPFACEVHGCGRNFSVVSNLRRHRKVHKGDRASDHGSPEGSWQSEKSVC